MTRRSCGKCTACCTTLAVSSIAKPDFQRCPQLNKFGCKVYARRPPECQDYACLWLQGDLDGRSLRPDRLGVVLTVAESQVFGQYIQLTEIRPGSVKSARVQKIIDALGAKLVVLHITKGRRVILAGPAKQIRLIRNKVANVLQPSGY